MREKDGGLRLCVDYRELNHKTVPDGHPIPRISSYGKNERLGVGLERDGSETSASFSQPTAVCCEEGADTVYVLDTSIRRLKMITSTLA